MKYMVGPKVKEYLKNHGITQAFLSRETGIPPAILSDRLSGNSEVKATELFLIGKALSVPLETFRGVAESATNGEAS